MKLVESAKSSGRYVYLVAYLEGGTRPIESHILCFSSEQARGLAVELNRLSEKQCEPLERP